MTREEIAALAARASARDLFSWKSPTARQRGIVPGAQSDAELVTLMAEEPRLIRRPLIISDDRVIIGAALKDLAELA